MGRLGDGQSKIVHEMGYWEMMGEIRSGNFRYMSCTGTTVAPR